MPQSLLVLQYLCGTFNLEVGGGFGTFGPPHIHLPTILIGYNNCSSNRGIFFFSDQYLMCDCLLA